MPEDKKITVVTHNSAFHTDDVFAVATLSLFLGKDNIKIIRSRDIDVLASGDYVVDVGGVDDPEKNRFDHHQSGGAGKRENGFPYASFGLVWKKFGGQICGSSAVAERIDKEIVQPVDFVDTDPKGLELFDSGIKGLYPFDIGKVRMFFSPTWKEDVTQMDEMFLVLVSYARALLERMIVFIKDEVEGEVLVLKSYNESADKRLIMIENSQYPWINVLHTLPEPIYVVYKNPKNDTWSLKAVRSPWSYKTKKDLPANWAGKREEELEKVTGVEGAIFCHNARFMVAAKTKEAILKLAKIALRD